jgi:hypothetical protein
MTAVELEQADAALAVALGQGRPGVGELAAIVQGAVRGLGRGDWWVPGPRERAGAVLRGLAIDRVVDVHAVIRTHKVGPSGPLRALHAVGLALAEPDRAVLVHIGAGSLGDGALIEALNLAALRSARVIFLLAQRSLVGAPVPQQSAASPAALALAYGVPTITLDGQSEDAVRDAVASARQTSGPTLIVADLG